MIEQRLCQVREMMKRRGYDAVVLSNVPDLRWLTGVNRVFDTERAHTVFITEDRLFLHTDTRYFNAFQEKLGENSGWELDQDFISHPAWIIKRAQETHARVVALEDSLSLKSFQQIKRAAEDESLALAHPLMHDALAWMRAIKDADEIKALQDAQDIADEAFTYLCERFDVGRTEKEMQRELDNKMMELGAEGVSFETIMASGPNGANPHAHPTDRKICKGDLVTIDFGVRYNDYCSDMTRTIAVGEPSEAHRHVYSTVLEAHLAAFAAIKPGVSGKDVHAIAQDLIDNAGFKGAFGHGLGHGVGIEVHELPVLSRLADNLLAPGHVVTDEPGIYLPGDCGVRIEDTGVVTEDGFASFARSPKELLVL